MEAKWFQQNPSKWALYLIDSTPSTLPPVAEVELACVAPQGTVVPQYRYAWKVLGFRGQCASPEDAMACVALVIRDLDDALTPRPEKTVDDTPMVSLNDARRAVKRVHEMWRKDVLAHAPQMNSRKAALGLILQGLDMGFLPAQAYFVDEDQTTILTYLGNHTQADIVVNPDGTSVSLDAQGAFQTHPPEKAVEALQGLREALSQ